MHDGGLTVQAIWVQAKQTVFAPNMFVSDCKCEEEENNDDDWCLCESTYIEQYICVESAGDEANIESSVDEILKQTIQEDADDDIAEVSEAELLDVISA